MECVTIVCSRLDGGGNTTTRDTREDAAGHSVGMSQNANEKASRFLAERSLGIVRD